jgi:hypothetical protein
MLILGRTHIWKERTYGKKVHMEGMSQVISDFCKKNTPPFPLPHTHAYGYIRTHMLSYTYIVSCMYVYSALRCTHTYRSLMF